MKTIRLIAISVLAFAAGLISCSKNNGNDGDKRISRVNYELRTRTLIEDEATGNVMYDNVETTVPKSEQYTWEDGRLKNSKVFFGEELYASLRFAYSEDGKLVEIIDDATSEKCRFIYSDHLDRYEIDYPKRPVLIMQFTYDDQGRISMATQYYSDESSLYVEEKCCKNIYDFRYSRENVSSYVFSQYREFSDSKPFFFKTSSFEYSSAINPFKGIYSPFFALYPELFISDNLWSASRVVADSGITISSENNEVIKEGNYPTKRIQRNTQTDVKDGLRTTIETTVTEYYEY